ncbi:Retrovirus-related Pol polyprotein from type-1 retrotransposable element R1, partial [Stegodyphus mimosarum]
MQSPLQIQTILKADNTKTQTQEETIMALLNYHFPKDSIMTDTLDHSLIRQDLERPYYAPNDVPFTVQEVECTIKSLNPGKSPEIDNIPREILLEVFYSNEKLHTKLFNELLKRGEFPNCWKTAKLVLFSKEGKNGEQPDAYRPICLLNTWSKVYDKLVTHRLSYYLNSNQKL